MIRFRNILVPSLMIGAFLPLFPADQPKKENAKPVNAAPAPVPEPPKAVPVPAPPRAVRPVRQRSTPATVRNEHAKPRVDSAASRQLPVVWDRNWATPITVEWEDAPTRTPPVVEARETSPGVTEELIAIKKNLEELTQMVRALTAKQSRQ